MTEYTTKILKLNEIAFWWLHASMEEARPKVCAVLPSLQRGFVWRTSQIELLWDSIAQGFPIGSLLLSAYDSKQVSVSGHGSDGPISNPTHLILDGQQRATALALGFRDIWSKPKTAVEALWVDLVSLKGDRHFAFRVVTKAHPWGYRRTDPNARLTAHDARKALEVYRYICGDEKIEPHKLDLSKTFPWDSEAPVPLALLINSIRENQFKSGNDFYKETIKSLGKSLSEISIWEKLVAYNGEGDKAREAIDEAREKIEKVNRIINGADNESLKDLVGGIRHALKNTEVPAAVLKLKQPVDEKNKSEKDDADENTPIFNLFKRINNGGTSLTREEINYSMLKSVWPGAREAIEGVDGEGGLLGGRQFAHPARMVSLITRLYIMSHTKDNDTTQLKNMQAELNISQFSTRLKDNEFISGLEGFCTNKGRVVVEETWKLLTEGEDSLPVVLAARLSQNADDLLLLLMYWIYQISKLKMKISDVTRSRTLGFVVSVSWFADDAKQCANLLIEKMNDMLELNEAELPEFFNRVNFKKILNRDNKGRILMKPLPYPVDFRCVLDKKITGHPDFRSMDGSSDLWKTGESWQHFHGNKGENTPKGMVSFFALHLDLDEKKDGQKISDVWWRFLEKVLNDKRFLLYVQRDFIKETYPWYDPTLPKQIRDHNRPWDYDHILPYSWSHFDSERIRNLPNLVRLWVRVNGNFRAWPLELNRSKSNNVIIEDEVAEIGNKSDVLKASFINDSKYWDKLKPIDESMFLKQGVHWKYFIRGSVSRSADIYEEWYTKLRIADLMG